MIKEGWEVSDEGDTMESNRGRDNSYVVYYERDQEVLAIKREFGIV